MLGEIARSNRLLPRERGWPGLRENARPRKVTDMTIISYDELRTQVTRDGDLAGWA